MDDQGPRSPDLARLGLLRDEIGGLASRLDSLERQAEEGAARADTAETRLAVGDARETARLESIEGLRRSISAILERLDGELARADQREAENYALARRLDGMEEQLLGIAGRADGNAAEVETTDKRLTVAEDSIRAVGLRLEIVETRDEQADSD
jgi:chromosome segregation ATPase